MSAKRLGTTISEVTTLAAGKVALLEVLQIKNIFSLLQLQ
jgi:hypothetical protein